MREKRMIFQRCLKTDASTLDREQFKSISGLILISFIGSLVCATFLSMAYSVIFTHYFALAAVMRRIYSDFEETV